MLGGFQLVPFLAQELLKSNFACSRGEMSEIALDTLVVLWGFIVCCYWNFAYCYMVFARYAGFSFESSVVFHRGMHLHKEISLVL